MYVAMQPASLAPSLALRWLAFAIALLVLAPVSRARAQGQGQAVDQNEAEHEPSAGQFHMLPQTREARQLRDRAQAHLSAGREEAALADLQNLLEGERASVLEAQQNAQSPSLYPLHRGAAQWARERLESLSPAGRAAYRERHEAQSRSAFERARALRSRAELAQVAQRWPLCASAVEALLASGELELESGSLADALRAFEAARDAARFLGETDAAKALAHALERRSERLLAAHPAAADPAALARAAFAGSSDFVRPSGGPLPALVRALDAGSWEVELPPHPFESGRGELERHNLFAIAAGESVLVSTTLELLCYDAHSGALRWRSGEPPGWRALTDRERRDRFAGIHADGLIVAPAQGRGIAVAALQTSWVDSHNRNFQGIKILVTTPERRLFAYDLATGAALWNHLPPPLWDGASGNFTERMRVAGPPVISGSRLLVPCYRLEGRIDYHVACYELESGALLWSTPVVSGQSELNMFNRAEREFCAPPLVVEGAHVYAQSQLGCVSALDLSSGRTLWSARYEQIPLPRLRSFRSQTRELVWRPAPPVVAGELLLVTPQDSGELIAIERASGRVLWAQDQRTLRPRGASEGELNVLLGADREAVYFGGSLLGAFRKSGGLHARTPLEPRWSAFLGEDAAFAPRALLALDALLAPGPERLAVHERELGLERPEATRPWKRWQSGNVLQAPTGLYTLNDTRLCAFLDWETLLAARRAAHEASGGSERTLLELVAALEQRAAARVRARARPGAIEDLEQARALLAAAAPQGMARATAPTVALLRVLTTLARERATLGEPSRALELLAEARQHAHTTPARLELALLELELRIGEADARSIELLLEIERDGAGQPLPAAWLEVHAERLAHGLVTPSALAAVAASSELELDAFAAWMLASLHAQAGEREQELIALERAQAALLKRESQPRSDLADFLELRIAGLLAEFDAPQRAASEARAQRALESAGADELALARVARVYAFSDAGAAARERLLQAALAADDLGAALRLGLAARVGQADPDEREAQLLLELGRALAAAGNPELAAALEGWIARLHPAFARAAGSDEHEARRAASMPLASRARFDASMRPRSAPQSNLRVLAELPARGEAEGGSSGGLVVARGTRIELWPEDEPRTSRWRHELAGGTSAQVAVANARRVVLACDTRLVALDAQSGALVWEAELGRGPIARLELASGLVLARTTSAGAGYDLACVEPLTGEVLWRLHGAVLGARLGPIAGEDALVLAGRARGGEAELALFELLRGRERARHALGVQLDAEMQQAAWIRHGRVWLPRFFRPDPQGAPALATLELWGAGDEPQLRAIAVDPPEELGELYAIATHAGRTWLVCVPADWERQDSGTRVYALDEERGLARRVASLRFGDVPLALPRGQRTELGAPLLFFIGEAPGGKQTSITAVDLERGPRWTHRLPVSPLEVYDQGMPMPAVSDRCVALTFALRDADTGLIGDPQVQLLDIAQGALLDTRMFTPQLARSSRLRLLPLGTSLLVLGSDDGQGEQLELWEVPR
jgi:outer membrane protein assembly factor BamB